MQNTRSSGKTLGVAPLLLVKRNQLISVSKQQM